MSTITTRDSPSLASDSNGVNGALAIKLTKQTDNNTPQSTSPYFSKPFLSKPSIKDLGITVDDSPEKDCTDGDQSSGGNMNETVNHPETKESPPDKPPRANNRKHYTNPVSPPHHPKLSERTLSYVSKSKPLASQRRKTSFIQQVSTETIKPVVLIATSDENKALLYPWRMNAIGHRNESLGVGIGLEFELSMEPRNMSRPVFRSPPRELLEREEERDCPNTIHVPPTPTSSNDISGTDKKLDKLIVCNIDEMSNHAVGNEDISPVSTQYPPKPCHFMMESGIYDRLETKVEPKISQFVLSEDFDRLLPENDPKTESQSPEYDYTQEDRDTIRPPTPLGSSTSPIDTPLGLSPSTIRRHVRRRSEDLSELSIAKERHMSVSPLQLSPARALRRQSVFESPQLTKRYLSPGVEESVNWEFLPQGCINHLGSGNEDKRKKNRWSIFGDNKPKTSIFYPRKPSKVQRLVSSGFIDINATNLQGDTPLHCYVKMDRPDKLDFLTAFLVHCKIENLEINKKDCHGNTPLHIATQRNDVWSVRILLAFGADINAQNNLDDAPLDMLSSRDSPEEIHELFMRLYALPGGRKKDTKPSFLNESLNSIINERYEIEHSERLGVYFTEERLTAFVFKLEQLLRKDDLVFSLRSQGDERAVRHSSGTFFDPLIAREKQGQAIQEWKSTLEFKRGVGSRVLFLDGGGIRGLIQIEVLTLIMKMTGREISDLFDWIVGTSTGAIVALGMVYANMNLSELRQMYFQLREEVFSGGIMGAVKRTEALEHILKKIFGDVRMCDRLPSSKCPNVLVSAVSTKTNPPQLHFFNNCFNNQYSQELVWKVARYTSAGPTYFTECDNYVDGGVLANNPCMEAWLEISKFHESRGSKPNVAMAVSIGTGIYPPEKLGEVDFFSKGFLDLRGTLNRAKKLIKMLSTALVESERVAEIFSHTCEAINTNFFRFSPALSHSIRPDETDIKVLIDMVIQTQTYLLEQSCKAKFDRMIRLFKHITEISRGLNLNKQHQQHDHTH